MSKKCPSTPTFESWKQKIYDGAGSRIRTDDLLITINGFGPALDLRQSICSSEHLMRAARLQDALERLTAAIRDVESELAAMKAEHDPLASHIFVSRRHYRNVADTKSGKRREMIARLSFNTACELGFRGNLGEWERLMAAVARR